MGQIKFNTIEEAISEIKKGRIIIVVDDENRENEGDFVMASELITAEAINFMATYGRGLICNPITKEVSKKLELPPMVEKNTATLTTAFTVSIDAAFGITTGISSKDRAHTIKLLTELDTKPSDFVRPGHIFPLIAKDGGVLERPGHTEAAVDLARLAGLHPAGTICEILDEDGSCARLPYLAKFAQKHDLKLVTIEGLIEYRRR